VGTPREGRVTKSNAVMGSLDYMAHEQREKTKDADHRSDIYALGVVFYEMLTGELPIGRFDPPSKKVKLEIDIDEVVLRVLAKDPERRYQRASDVGSEIRRRLDSARRAAGEPEAELVLIEEEAAAAAASKGAAQARRSGPPSRADEYLRSMGWPWMKERGRS